MAYQSRETPNLGLRIHSKRIKANKKQKVGIPSFGGSGHWGPSFLIGCTSMYEPWCVEGFIG
jgi:hypothetical protein